MPKDSSSTPETQVKPDPVLEKRTRRIYTVEYKMKIMLKRMPVSMVSLGHCYEKRNYTAISFQRGDVN